MSAPDYPALAQWARPDADEPLPGIKIESPFAYTAAVFRENIDRVRALAVLPGVVAAHAYGAGIDLAIGADRLEQSKDTLWVSTGTKALFASVVIGAWTAFEVLSGDLWCEVVNRVPLLGVRALDAEPLADDDEPTQDRKAKKMVSVVAQRLLDPKFDLRQSLGDVLSDDFPMTSFARIVSAYKAVFDDKAVTEIIRDVGVRSVSAVRNVLVHRAGVADGEFRKQVKGDPRFSAMQNEERVELTGTVTAELVESARTQGFKLIRFVDGWYQSRIGTT